MRSMLLPRICTARSDLWREGEANFSKDGDNAICTFGRARRHISLRSPPGGKLRPALVAILVCFSCAGWAQEAEKQKERPAGVDQLMRARLVRSASAGCEPKCPEWISAQGSIVAGSAESLRKVVNSIYPRKLPVLIESEGGLYKAATQMGTLIRNRHLDVAVARTNFEPCADVPVGCKRGAWNGDLGQPDKQPAACVSACTLVLAGGVRRFVPPGAQVAVRKPKIDERIVEIWRRGYKGARPLEEVIERHFDPRVAFHVRRYLIMMGISREIPALMESTPPTDLRILTHEELEESRLATDFQDGQTLIDQSAK